MVEPTEGDNVAPSRNGGNGRDSQGRFARGNAGGPGNPHAQRTAEIREAMLAAVAPADVRAIVKTLVKLTKNGAIPP